MSSPVITIETQHEDMVHDAQLDYYGNRVATCSSDRKIKVYDISKDEPAQEQILTGHEGPVWQVAWAHPKFGVMLASCSYDQKVIIYQENEEGVWSQLHIHAYHRASVHSIAWGPYEYGLTLACASADGKVSVLSHTTEGWSTKFFQDSTLGCNSVSWAPYNSSGSHDANNWPIKRLVTGSCDNTVKLWQCAQSQGQGQGQGQTETWVRDTASMALPSPHTDWVRDVAWAPSTGMPCNTIASCSEDHTVYIWTQNEANAPWSYELLHTFDAPVWRLSWSLTGNVLAVSSGDQKVTLWKQSIDKKWIQVSSVDEVGALQQMKKS